MDDIRRLRRVVLDEVVKASYARILREKIHEDLHELLTKRLDSGEIHDDASLAQFWRSFETTVDLLKRESVDELVESRKV